MIAFRCKHESAEVKIVSVRGHVGVLSCDLFGGIVTGQRSDQLSYAPRLFFNNSVICHIESSVSQLSALIPFLPKMSVHFTQDTCGTGIDSGKCSVTSFGPRVLEVSC